MIIKIIILREGIPFTGGRAELATKKKRHEPNRHRNIIKLLQLVRSRNENT